MNFVWEGGHTIQSIAGIQLFIIFLYNSFDFCKVDSDALFFIFELVICIFSLFFLVNLDNSLSILLIYSKNKLLVC